MVALGEEPAEEGVERLSGAVDAVRHGCPAASASPPLRPCARLAVALHRPAAGAALRVVHSPLPSEVNFLFEKATPSGHVNRDPDTHSVRLESWFTPTFWHGLSSLNWEKNS